MTEQGARMCPKRIDPLMPVYVSMLIAAVVAVLCFGCTSVPIEVVEGVETEGIAIEAAEQNYKFAIEEYNAECIRLAGAGNFEHLRGRLLTESRPDSMPADVWTLSLVSGFVSDQEKSRRKYDAILARALAHNEASVARELHAGTADYIRTVDKAAKAIRAAIEKVKGMTGLGPVKLFGETP